MMQIFDHLRTRPRLMIAMAVGIVVALAVPGIEHANTRALIGWNTTVWLLLALMGLMMVQSDHEHLRRMSIAQAESAPVVLGLATIAAVFSIFAIVVELAAAKQAGMQHAVPHILLALSTVAGSWLLLPTLFAMNYASLYHARHDGSGLLFPDRDRDRHFNPDYTDFLYFSFTIAVASQTADIAISSRPMRRLVLLQALLSFLFNTTILAFTINIGASLF